MNNEKEYEGSFGKWEVDENIFEAAKELDSVNIAASSWKKGVIGERGPDKLVSEERKAGIQNPC